jgi:hypothetical protein
MHLNPNLLVNHFSVLFSSASPFWLEFKPFSDLVSGVFLVVFGFKVVFFDVWQT